LLLVDYRYWNKEGRKEKRGLEKEGEKKWDNYIRFLKEIEGKNLF
jgi:hypothetical protein